MDVAAMIEQGTASPIFLVVTAVALGALHGLEPGHSKTMMAAFIIAVRGTPWQAVLLGLSAAFSHSVIVWVLALLALTYGDEMIAENMEPWFFAVSGAIVLAIASWVFVQTWRGRTGAATHHHEHHHDGDHHHNHHGHDHATHEGRHAQAHAREIEKRFASGRTTTGQVVMFGITGGLLPCAAAVTVLIICLHLKKFWLGVGLVGAFSAGLALTLVAVGVVAAVGVSAARKKYPKLDAVLAKAPYVSSILIGLIGIAMLASGAHRLSVPN